MIAWRILIFAIAATATFLLLGVLRITYILRPEVFVLFIFLIAGGLVVATFFLSKKNSSHSMGRALIYCLVLGITMDFASKAIDVSNKAFGFRRLAIEKSFMEFQANGCKDVDDRIMNTVVRIANLNETNSGKKAIIIDGSDQKDVRIFISEDAYQSAAKSSARHGLLWLFDLLREGVYTWDVRQVLCTRG